MEVFCGVETFSFGRDESIHSLKKLFFTGFLEVSINKTFRTTLPDTRGRHSLQFFWGGGGGGKFSKLLGQDGGEENFHKLIYTNKYCIYFCQCSAQSKTEVVDLPSYDNILFTWQPLVGVLNSKREIKVYHSVTFDKWLIRTFPPLFTKRNKHKHISSK